MSTGDPRRVRAAMRAMETQLQGLVAPTEQRLHDAERLIREITALYDEAVADLDRALRQAEADLDYCESLEDEDGRRPDCRPYYRRCQELRRAMAQLTALGQQFERQAGRYQSEANALRQVIDHDIPAATHWLRDRERALEKFEGDSVGVRPASAPRARGPKAGDGGSNIDFAIALGAAAVATANPTLLSAFGSFFEGMGNHGYKYQKERQAFLCSRVDDPNEPRYVRGWIRQELNRIDAGQRAKAAGLQPPGGSPRHVRGIPGLDVGHRYPGLDHRLNFRLEDSWSNRRRPIIARRLGISDLFR